jgi:hypothetical protein
MCVCGYMQAANDMAAISLAEHVSVMASTVYAKHDVA